MPKYSYTAPDGTPFDVEAASPEAADQIIVTRVIPDFERNQGIKPPVKRPVNVSPIDTNPAAGMSMVDRLGAGLVGGIHNVVGGLARKADASTPHIEEERALFNKYKGGLGLPGMVGEGGGEIVATPVGGPLKAVGKMLTKAVPALGRMAGYGGRVVNPGTVARGAAEGAIAQEITDDNGAEGAVQGAATPVAAKVIAAPFKAAGKLTEMVSPLAASVRKRAYEAFERELGGRTGATDAMRKITDASPSMLPKSTAALTGDVGLGALERGARTRRNVDWQSYDENVGRTAFKELQDMPGQYRSEAGDILREQFNRGGVPQTRKVVGQFGDLENQVPKIEAPVLRRALGKLSPGLTDMELSHGKQLANELGQYEASLANTGRTAPNYGAGRDLVSAAMALTSAGTSSTMLWKLRAAFNAVTGGSMSKTSKVIDEALLDPNKFVELVSEIQAKTDKGRPLSAAEAVIKQALLSSAHTDMVPN